MWFCVYYMPENTWESTFSRIMNFWPKNVFLWLLKFLSLMQNYVYIKKEEESKWKVIGTGQFSFIISYKDPNNRRHCWLFVKMDLPMVVSPLPFDLNPYPLLIFFFQNQFCKANAIWQITNKNKETDTKSSISSKSTLLNIWRQEEKKRGEERLCYLPIQNPFLTKNVISLWKLSVLTSTKQTKHILPYDGGRGFGTSQDICHSSAIHGVPTFISNKHLFVPKK